MAHGFENDLATKQKVEPLSNVRLVGATVAVVSGPDSGEGAKIGLAGLVVGSGSNCDLRLSDKLVSRNHLELRAEVDGVRVLDRGSRNGTFWSGARIHDVKFSKDARLFVGETTLELKLVGQALDLPISARSTFGGAIGESAGMRYVFNLLEQAAKTDVTVLLEGESGTGKEVLAHALHEESARKNGPFVVIDCGAIPENLVESELFGHERGAFTGAVHARPGAFEQAHEGTLFLDEIGELPPGAQPKLLRALENRSFRRVGGSQVVRVDVRVVAATNRKLRESVRKKEMREDLFYRLAVVHVTVPRLAERKADIAPLAQAFLRKASGDKDSTLPPELIALLESYSWPGNARELRNVVERFATFGRTDAAMLFGDSPREPSFATFDFASFSGLPYHEAKEQLMEMFHKTFLPEAVDKAGGNVPKAAERLGLPKASLYRMLQQIRGNPMDPNG